MSHVVGAVTCVVADIATRSPMDASYFTAGEKKVAVEDSMGLRGDTQRDVHCLVYVPLEVQSLIETTSPNFEKSWRFAANNKSNATVYILLYMHC